LFRAVIENKDETQAKSHCVQKELEILSWKLIVYLTAWETPEHPLLDATRPGASPSLMALDGNSAAAYRLPI
jgi:hypothetical protein